MATAVALGVVALHLDMKPLPGLETVEGLSVDARFRLRGSRGPATDRVVVVGIDDETRARHPEVLQTRRGYAELIRALTKYDAKVIALDLFFSSPEVILPEALEADVRVTSAELLATPPTDPTAARVATLLAKIMKSSAATSSSRLRSGRVSASFLARTSSAGQVQAAASLQS